MGEGATAGHASHEVESWTVVDDAMVPVASVERFLAHLAAIERSPGTVKAYAHSLTLWFEWLTLGARSWDTAGIEDVSEFVRWLRAPADNVIVLDASASRRSEATVNRHLAAVFGFYDFHARAGVELAASLVAWRGSAVARTSRSCSMSTAGMRAETVSASSTSAAVGAPNVVPSAAASATASSTSGCAWPWISGPQEHT